MAFIINSLYWLTVIVFLFGQLARINLFGINFPVIDLMLGLLALLSLVLYFKKPSPLQLHPWLIFLILSWFSFLFNLIVFRYPFLKSLFYQLRLNFLLLLFILPRPKFSTNKPFLLILAANVVFGLIQYFVWPDATFFKSLEWDPHFYRLISTFFDPTFTGLIYLLFLLYLYFNKSKLIFPVYIAMALTYSRSTFLAFAVAFAFIAYVKKNIKIFLIALILMISTILLLPRFDGEGTKLERDSSIIAKIHNYQQGITLFTQSPFIGTGYNFLPIIRSDLKQNSHAIGGFDGSLLTILITNGILGFPAFILGLFLLFKQGNLFRKASLIVIFVHSLFANSLLYPWVLLFLYLI
ncbi:MAG: O-antigen ligase family protein [Candidatus Shapirobacteria bacterium]|nr:O-antigen ligase family protein [Candidatus Shapirobacteria bacterium]